jgi:hypothetical protein
MRNSIIEKAKEFCETKHLNERHDEDVPRIVESFKKVVPATGAQSLASIVNAAWRLFLENENCWKEVYRITKKKPEKRVELIRALALKSIEVFQIERIQGGEM